MIPVGAMRFELITLGFGGRYSIQMSYAPEKRDPGRRLAKSGASGQPSFSFRKGPLVPRRTRPSSRRVTKSALNCRRPVLIMEGLMNLTTTQLVGEHDL